MLSWTVVALNKQKIKSKNIGTVSFYRPFLFLCGIFVLFNGILKFCNELCIIRLRGFGLCANTLRGKMFIKGQVFIG